MFNDPDTTTLEEVIAYLRHQGKSSEANKVLVLKEQLELGSKQYQAGATAILEIEKALQRPVPRDLILSRIHEIVKEVKKVL